MDKAILNYAKESPLFVRMEASPTPGVCPRYSRDEGTNTYAQLEETAMQEAVLVCGGEISYDAVLEKECQYSDGDYDFRSVFKYLRSVFSSGDLAVSSLGTVVSDHYPTTGKIPQDSKVHQLDYKNAPVSLMEAISYSGLDALAVASPHNVDFGPQGILDTAEAMDNQRIVPFGVGDDKTALFHVNGIAVGCVSYTIACNNPGTLTEEGAAALLNPYHKERAQAQIKALRMDGADFCLVYVNYSDTGTRYDFAARKNLGIELGELGGDLIVFTNAVNIVSKVVRHTAQDGREVVIATSLGCLVGGTGQKKAMKATLLLKVRVSRLPSGEIAADYNYIPCQKYRYYKGSANPVIPVPPLFNGGIGEGDLADAAAEIADKIAGTLPVNSERVISSSYLIPQLTLEEIYKTLGARMPGKVRRKHGNGFMPSGIIMRKEALQKGCVAVVEGVAKDGSGRAYYDKSKINFIDAEKAGAVLIVSKEPYKGQLPCILVKDPVEAFLRLSAKIRDRYNPKTIAITGTVGKTTTKDLVGAVMSSTFNTMYVKGNLNTYRSAGECIQKLDAQTEVYVQEVHGGTPGSAATVSKMARPDACMITNIGEGHIGQMGSLENITREKLSIIQGMNPQGVLFLNHDNDVLAAQKPEVRTIWYSSFNTGCDYYARNIVDTGEKATFEIVCSEGVFPAVVNLQGIHNVNNAVGVFAVGRWAGVPAHRIIAAISRHRPEGVRQNIVDYRGYRLFLDCYSATVISMVSAVKALAAYPVAKGNKRVAVLTDIADLGAYFDSIHLDVGRQLAEEKIDLMICNGKYARHFAEEAQKKGIPAYYFSDIEPFERCIISHIRPGDVVLFKGSSMYSHLEDAVRDIFGKII